MGAVLAVVCPMLALLAGAGLCLLAPRRAPLLYLGPASCTVTLITLTAAYVAAVWSH